MSAEAIFIIIVIAIPTFFLLRWVLKRFIADKKTRNWTSIIGTLIIAPLIYITLMFGFLTLLFYEPQYDFNREKWFSEKQNRFEMRDDIVTSKILIGKSRDEITEFIGPPDSKVEANLWVYYLGVSGAGFGIQFNRLELNFENEQVKEVKKVEIKD